MNINIAKDNAFEADGIPFTGALSFINPAFTYSNEHLQIHWKATAKTGNIKVWFTLTNQFKTGGKDDYVLLGTVPVAAQKALFNLPGKPSAFYKIVLQGDSNTSNYWIEKK